MTLQEGIHEGVPMEEYVRDPAPEPSLSTGILHALYERSPLHAFTEHPRLNKGWRPDESSRADIGSAVHACILGGKDIVFAPDQFQDWRKKEAQEFRDAARMAGKIPLLEKDKPNIVIPAKHATEFMERSGWWPEDRMMERTLIWQEGKIWKRARPDVLVSGTLVLDVKTTENANPEAWIRTALISGGYDIQAVNAMDGVARTCNVDPDDIEFIFILCEISPPYAVAAVSLNPEFLECARAKVRTATRLWERCMRKNEWPGYDARVHYAEPPKWELSRLTERIQDRAEDPMEVFQQPAEPAEAPKPYTEEELPF